jgi:hypothetical protein
MKSPISNIEYNIIGGADLTCIKCAIFSRGRDVRFWHLADIPTVAANVRFWTNADISRLSTIDE